MSWICKTLTLALSIIVLNALLAAEAQWALSGPKFTVGNKQFHIEAVDDTKNFFQAANECTKLGMTLASIESKAEFKRLFTVLGTSENLDKEYWLGGTSMANNDNMFWLATGKNIQYWPDDDKITGTDVCLKTTVTDNNNVNDFNYENADCTENRYFICEKSLEPYCGQLGRCKRN